MSKRGHRQHSRRSKPSVAQSATGNYIAQAAEDGSAAVNVTQYITQNTPEVTSLPLHQLPPPVADFTGRARELDTLRKAITEHGSRVIGITGMAGIGKTALALKLASEVIDRYEDGQIYVDLRGVSDAPAESSAVLAQVVASFLPRERLADSIEALRRFYYSMLYNKHVILVFDNVANYDQVDALTPPASCLMIMTSRRRIVLPGMITCELGQLDIEDCTTLLTAISPRADQYAVEIAELCAGLPLALRLAGRTLAEQLDLSVSEYVSLLRHAPTRLRLWSKIDTVVALSYTLLPADIQRLWRMLAVFPADFDVGGAAAVMNTAPEAAHDWLSELVQYNLLEYDPTTERYRLHDVSRLVAGGRLNKEEEPLARRQHATYYAHVLQATRELFMQGGENIPRAIRLFDQEWLNVRAGQLWAATNMERDPQALLLGSIYPDAGAYVIQYRIDAHEQLTWLQTALRAATRLNDRRLERIYLTNIGDTQRRLGESEKAVRSLERALQLDRQDGDREGEATNLASLGSLQEELGNNALALELLAHALTIFREIRNRHGEGSTLIHLGNFYRDTNDLEMAKDLYEQSLLIFRELGARVEELQLLVGLSRVNQQLDHQQQSLEYALQALSIGQALSDKPGTFQALVEIGIACEALKQIGRAKKELDKALELSSSLDDAEIDPTRLVLLGEFYTMKDEPRNALKCFERILIFARKQKKRINEASALARLGDSKLRLGDRENANVDLQSALAIFREVGESQGEAATLGSLGDVCRESGQLQAAEDYYRQQLSKALQLSDQSSQASALSSIGLVWLETGDSAKAFEYLQQALATVQKTGTRWTQGAALGNLGAAYFELGKVEFAIELYKRALVIRREVSDRRGESNDMWNLSLALDKGGDRVGALASAEEALHIREEIGDTRAEKVRRQLDEWHSQATAGI